LSIDVAEGSKVVNTWFVDSPVPSDEISKLEGKLSADLDLAADFISEATAVLIVAGAGKSYLYAAS